MFGQISESVRREQHRFIPSQLAQLREQTRSKECTVFRGRIQRRAWFVKEKQPDVRLLSDNRAHECPCAV